MDQSGFYIHDTQSRTRNTLVIISLVILFLCLLFGLYTNPSDYKLFQNNGTTNTIQKTITTTTTTKNTIFEPPAPEVLKPIINTIENTEIINKKTSEINWIPLFVILTCILLMLLCAYLIYCLYKSDKNLDTQAIIQDGQPIVNQITDPLNNPNVVIQPIAPKTNIIGNFTGNTSNTNSNVNANPSIPNTFNYVKDVDIPVSNNDGIVLTDQDIIYQNRNITNAPVYQNNNLQVKSHNPVEVYDRYYVERGSTCTYPLMDMDNDMDNCNCNN